jgi:thioredoxin reductase
MGLVPKNLNVPGEEKFSGKGISYCANCDGPFYKDRTVAVIGGGNAALDAAEVMSKIAKKVYLVQLFDNFTGFEVLVNEVRGRDNIEIHTGTKVTELVGAEKLEKIKIQEVASGKESEIAVDGMFIEIGREAKTGIVKELVKTDDRNQIIVNECCATSQPGIFAAGDVTQTPFKQITVACGQGTTAALAAYQYLQMHGNKRCRVCCPTKEE